MIGLGRNSTKRASESSFLPEDYLARKTERRTNLIAVTLFVIVTAGVIGAFFVTNRQWNDVRQYQKTVNVRYAQAAKDIEQLKTLEQRKGTLLDRAELTTALIEKVPRSVLLAELINRMPERMTLLELKVTSERTTRKVRSRAAPPEDKDAGKSLSRKKRTARGSKAEPKPEPVILAPRFNTLLDIIAVAPQNTDVATYLKLLQECELLENVEIRYTQASMMNDRGMFKFRITAKLREDADARDIDPTLTPRLVEDAGTIIDESVRMQVERSTVSVPVDEQEVP